MPRKREILDRGTMVGKPHIVEIFALSSPYTVRVWNLPETRICDYTIRCKGCGEKIPAPVMTMPDTWIVAECVLCGQRRSYMPTDIFRGRPHICCSHRVSRRDQNRGFADMGEMRRAIAREQEEERRKQDRSASTIVIAAAIIAAVRLARDEISKPTPRATSAIAESVALARTIPQRILL